jgi:hypothetical protein
MNKQKALMIQLLLLVAHLCSLSTKHFSFKLNFNFYNKEPFFYKVNSQLSQACRNNPCKNGAR